MAPVTPPDDPRQAVTSVPAGRAALAGALAAVAALAAGELLAGLSAEIPSPLLSVGGAVIDLAPAGSKEVMVGLFGTGDKAALLVLVTAVVLSAGALIGVLARRTRVGAGVLVGALACVGALASLRDASAAAPLVILGATLQAGLGLQVLMTLLAAAGSSTGTGASVAGSSAGTGTSAASAGPERRRFLVRALAVGGLALAGGTVGRLLANGRAAAEVATLDGAGSAPSIPPVADPAPSPGPDASLAVPGITPVVTPNDRFYRIDTALLTPAVDLATWSLRVFGMVDHELRLSFAELVGLPLIERYVTIACVSNEVGGELVGNARWTGPRLADVLDMAGAQPGATQIVPRSVDGWTAGFPSSWLHDPAHPREAIIAVAMNGARLPPEHGFPARLIVPGLYGYVSATKWLAEIELTTLAAFDAYWVPRGWAKEAPILTQSRIDVPRDRAELAPGPIVVAGVAWAPDRGISSVEVRVDEGSWQRATLATELSPATWVQWMWTWPAEAGPHVVEVRATDGDGVVQTAQSTPPDPDGARGHHRIAVQVA